MTSCSPARNASMLTPVAARFVNLPCIARVGWDRRQASLRARVRTVLWEFMPTLNQLGGELIARRLRHRGAACSDLVGLVGEDRC